MSTTKNKSSDQTGPLEVYRYAAEKPILALDALSKLTRQFADRPEFDHLIELILLTVSGQFSVPGACIVILDKNVGDDSPILYFGSGKLKGSSHLTQNLTRSECTGYFEENPGAWSMPEDAAPEDSHPKLAAAFWHEGVRLMAPMMQGDNLIGVIGLCAKVNRKPFARDEVNLFGTLANTITPLLVNSLLFRELNSLNAWYLDILNNVRLGMLVFDSEARLKNINAAGRGMLSRLQAVARTEENLIGKSFQDVFSTSAFPGWHVHFKQCRHHNGPRQSERLVASGPNGERIFNVRISEISSDANIDADLIVTLDDITAQKENEQRFFELEKFAEKGMMASSIAHELNNFLGLVLGGVELAQIAIGKNKVDKAAASLEKLKTNVGTMSRFTAGLVDYSRMNSQKERVNLNAVVSDVLSFVKVQKKFTRIQLGMELDPVIPSLDLDTDQIAQVLLNFLNNAADAIRETNRLDGAINIETQHIDGIIVLKVSDNGAGIPPEVQKRLFKAHLTTKKDGHGYGLVTCGKILENHSATVDIESQVGRGTTFILSFSVSPEN